ncbi:hypothetical protein ACWKWU_12680 [Chitinophaga lutea]
MRRTILCLFAAASLAAVSCKKDKDKDKDEPSAGARYLVKVTETTNGADDVYTLTWNAQNKLTGNKLPGVSDQQFTYDAAGRLSKYVTIDEETGTTDTYTFTYTATGLPQRYERSIVSDDNEPVTSTGTYVLNAGKVTRIVEKDHETLHETLLDIEYTGNNVTRLHAASPEGLDIEIKMTYGEKRNPMTAARQPYVLLADFAVEGFSANELLTMLTESEIADFSSTVTYQYDPSGYPIASTLKENGVVKTTAVYTYR